jgi:hypothetical protein
MHDDSTSKKRNGFWGTFEAVLGAHGVQKEASGYYRRHLERWGAFRRRYAGEGSTRALCERYLRELGGNPRWKDWQVLQVVQAIRWAHGDCLKEAWVNRVDWEALETEFQELNLRDHEVVGAGVGLEEIEARARTRGFGAARAAMVAEKVKWGQILFL